MGVEYKLKCHQCGYTFSRSYGVGFNGQGTLYCDRCGRSQAVDFSGGMEYRATCECGGTFDADALGRCPQCGAVLAKDDIEVDEPHCLWD